MPTPATLSLELEMVRPLLPPRVEFYDINGVVIFPVYGDSGSISTKSVSFLIRRGEGEVPAELDNGAEFPREDGITDFGNGWKIARFAWNLSDFENRNQHEMALRVAKVAQELA